MIYPTDNRFILSSNPHSLGVMNDMETTPTWQGPSGLVQLTNQKQFIAAGALINQPNPPTYKAWGGFHSIWR